MKTDSAWYKRMKAKYKTDEAIRKVMKDNGDKSSRNNVGTGGFAKLTPEERKEVSRKGVESRRQKSISQI